MLRLTLLFLSAGQALLVYQTGLHATWAHAGVVLGSWVCGVVVGLMVAVIKMGDD